MAVSDPLIQEADPHITKRAIGAWMSDKMVQKIKTEKPASENCAFCYDNVKLNNYGGSKWQKKMQKKTKTKVRVSEI